MNSNIKDTVSTICAWVTVVGGALLGAHALGQIVLPEVVLGILGAIVGIATAITQFLTGKNPDGSKKSESQVERSNTIAKEDKALNGK